MSDRELMVFSYVRLRAASGYTQEYLHYHDLVDAHGETAVLSIRASYGACEDSVSERKYDYSVIFQYGELILAGCADRAE